MSSKPESSFIAGVHKHLPPGRRNPYWMKNHNVYTAGVWDIWYSGSRRSLWIEYKFIDRIPKDGIIIPKLSELQMQWGLDRQAEKQNLVVVIGTKTGGFILGHPNHWKNGLLASVNPIYTRKEIAEWIIDYTEKP